MTMHFITIIPLQNVDDTSIDDYSELQHGMDEECRIDFKREHPLNKPVTIGYRTAKKIVDGHLITGKTTPIKRPLVQLLINPWTKDMLETISPKVFYAINGQYPHQSSINKKGRIPIELAIDVIATELGYEDGEALKSAISEVVK